MSVTVVETFVNKHGKNALLIASSDGDIDMVRALLNKGEDIRYTEKGNIDVVRADVHRLNENESTALFLASMNGHAPIVEALLEAGADVHHANNSKNTALITASCGGHTEIVRALLKAGANIHDADRNGWTALQLASHNGHIEIVNTLWKKGADVDHKNEE